MVEFYNQLLSYGTIQGAKLPSLDEFLSLSLGDGSNEAKAFDKSSDKFLEDQALKKLYERRLNHGR